MREKFINAHKSQYNMGPSFIVRDIRPLFQQGGTKHTWCSQSDQTDFKDQSSITVGGSKWRNHRYETFCNPSRDRLFMPPPPPPL